MNYTNMNGIIGNNLPLKSFSNAYGTNSYVAKNGMQDENEIQTWSSVSSINVNSV